METPVTKVCRRCGKEKELKWFRTRPSGFTLNQCRECELEMNKERRLKKKEPQMIKVTSRSGKEIMCSVTPITGGKIATSPKTDKVLYFENTTTRDDARLALSSYADIPRTEISYHNF